MTGWGNRSPATAEVLASACHWQVLEPYFLFSGHLCWSSQGSTCRTGREVIAGWVHVCLPHICGGLGSTEAENNHLCLLLAKMELATHARRAFSHRALPVSGLLHQLRGRHGIPAAGVPKLLSIQVVHKKLPASVAVLGLLPEGR